VHYAPGVSGIVHFGEKWPTVPERAIEEIRAQLETDGICQLEDSIEAGETVEIAGHAFLGLQAVVTQVMPGKQRVMVLMDFLGRQSMVEVGAESIIRRGFDR
jgi:transcription antitermination factor NusG